MARSSDDPTAPSPEMVQAALMFAEAERVLVEVHNRIAHGRCRCGLEDPCVQAGSATAIRDYWLARYRAAVAARQAALNARYPAGQESWTARPVPVLQRLAA